MRNISNHENRTSLYNTIRAKMKILFVLLTLTYRSIQIKEENELRYSTDQLYIHTTKSYHQHKRNCKIYESIPSSEQVPVMCTSFKAIAIQINSDYETSEIESVSILSNKKYFRDILN
jgi:hypothetical protein